MEKQTARLEAFSDGIFGVAITLLAIEIGIKEYENATNLKLWQKIIADWPQYFTYFNSFASVLLIWMGHHNIFKKIWRLNHWVILLNGLLLLLVVLFPFPTKTVGTFIGTNAVNTAVSFYAAFTGFIVVAMLLLTLFIINNKKIMINPDKDMPWFKNTIKGHIIGIAVYTAAAIIAFYSAFIALAITFGMWVFWAIVSKDIEEEEYENKTK